MPDKKELNQEQLNKVSGGEETTSTHGLFKPGVVNVPMDGGAVYNDGGIQFKPVTDQYQPDLVNPTDQGGVDNTEITNSDYGVSK